VLRSRAISVAPCQTLLIRFHNFCIAGQIRASDVGTRSGVVAERSHRPCRRSVEVETSSHLATNTSAWLGAQPVQPDVRRKYFPAW
jgi:hypothetical protein